jgi:two-component system KDP operon response regulator KdpE
MNLPDAAPPPWPARIIAVATPVSDITRGRPAEFRQRGLLVEGTSSVAAALISLAQDPLSVALVPTDLRDMPLLDFLDVLRAFSAKQVIVGVTPEADNATVVAALDRGGTRVVNLPVTAVTLAQAVEESRPRQTAPVEPERYVVGRLELDVVSYRVFWHDAEVHLAPRLFELLRYLAATHPRVVSLDELATDFGGRLDTPDRGERVRVMIGRIRSQLTQTQPDLPPPLETVHRVGYRLAG